VEKTILVSYLLATLATATTMVSICTLGDEEQDSLGALVGRVLIILGLAAWWVAFFLFLDLLGVR
jgi:hypothetical protein